MNFQVPSSSPPSTPDSQPRRGKSHAIFASMSNNISTTPAGPPPSSAPSFTPAGQPPSTVFGSSIFGNTGPSKLRFTNSPEIARSSSSSNVNHATRSSFQVRNNTPAKPSGLNNFQVPSSSPFGAGPGSSPIQNHSVNENENADLASGSPNSAAGSGDHYGNSHFDFKSMLAGRPGSQLRKSHGTRSSLGSSRTPKKRSAIANQGTSRLSELPRKGNESAVQAIAGNMVKRRKTATLVEEDDMILQTEFILSDLGDGRLDSDNPVSTDSRVSKKSAELIRTWNLIINNDPELSEDLLHAVAISSLWIGTYHPPLETSVYKNFNRISRDLSLIQHGQESAQQSVPRVLLDWLDNFRPTVEESLEAVRTMRPNCTAHEFFWETIHALAVRGKITEIVQLFQEADFKYASSALLDGQEHTGYRGAQLQSVQGAVNRARQTLELCPAVRRDDWNTIGQEWVQYRQRVTSDLAQLVEIAEGGDHFPDDEDEEPQVDSFTLTGRRTNLSQTTRQAMSRIPWNVYESLKILHRVLLGSTAEILAISQDFLEASVGLTVWWDGADEDRIYDWTLSVARQSRPLNQGPTIGSTNGFSFQSNPYIQRLKSSFLYVTDPETTEGLTLNPDDAGEVGLAAALQGDADLMVGMLQTLSVVVASAMAELGVAAGWLGTSGGPTLDMMSEDDMDVLNYGQEQRKVTKDGILATYIAYLFDRQEIYAGTVTKEGWEVAISVAKRLDDHNKASQTIHDLFDRLQLGSQDRMNKVLRVCTDLGLIEEARKVSERFAEHLTSTSTLYGPALLAYARAQSPAKLSALVSLLISYTLVQSAPYPASSSLDPALSALLANPKPLLASVQETSGWGAGMLQFHLAGYATLRRFYDLRDNAAAEGQKLRPLARKRAAARQLVTAINSAADSIYGGLYDESRKSAIEVDGLLPLLGEATALLGQGSRNFTVPQMYDLLSAVEDLSTVNERVRAACEECLDATLRNYNGSAPPSPHAMLKKSVSSGTNSNFSFSMMGSEMVGSTEVRSVGSSGVLVGGKAGKEKIHRGWDWREIVKGKQSITGDEIISRLRVALVKELATAELEGNPMDV